METFKCLRCSSVELSFEKWVHCREKVVIQPDGHIEFYDQQVNDEEMLGAEYRFICGCCGKPLMLYGSYVMVEDRLRDYLSMTIDQRIEMQAEYDAMVEEDAQGEEEITSEVVLKLETVNKPSPQL